MHAEYSHLPLYILCTPSSILHELVLFTDDRVSQQHRNVKQKQHVSLRTKQKVSLGFLSWSGIFPFLYFPYYAFCLQITQQFSELVSGALLLRTKNMLQKKRGKKGHKSKYIDEMFLLHMHLHNTYNRRRSYSVLLGKSQTWCVLRSIDK